MPGMRYQPPGLARIRRDLIGRVVGSIFTNSRTDIGGSGADVSIFGNPDSVTSSHGMARKFTSAKSTYATIAPPAGLVDLSQPYADVIAFVPDSTAVGRLYSYTDSNGIKVQLLFGTAARPIYAHQTSSDTVGNAWAEAVPTIGVPLVICSGWDGAAFFMYINGAKQAGATNGTIAAVAATAAAGINIGRKSNASSYVNAQISLYAHIAGQVDPRALSLNPWSLFEDLAEEEEAHFVAAATVGGDTSLAGAAVAQSSASGALTTSVRFAGGATAQSSAAAALTTSVRLAGSTAAQVSAGAALSTAIRLSGAAVAQSSASGALAGGAAALTGAAVVQSSAAGALSTAILLTGAASSSVAASGTMAVPGAALAGAAVAQSSASGALLTTIRLSGDAQGAVSMSGALAGAAVALSGAAVAGASGSGALSTAISLGGVASARASGTGVLLTWVRLTGAVQQRATLGGNLSVGINYARAPAGSGYSPRRNEYQARPAQAGGARPSAIEKAYR
jgi:hypothetical protein